MGSYSHWGESTRAAEVAEAFATNIRDKTVVLTGASPKSIGAATAKAIASQRPGLLILASRTASNIEAVIKDIREEYGEINCRYVVVDFSSFASARAAAGNIRDMVGLGGGIDVLINNAGINVPGHETTQDGFEMQWQTNHLGPFLFTQLLLPKLRLAASRSTAGAVRVVNVSSEGHMLSPIRFSDPNFNKLLDELPEEERTPASRMRAIMPKRGESYSPVLAYAQTKTANVLMARYIGDAFQKDGIAGFSVHPGAIWSNLGRHFDDKFNKMLAASVKFWKSPEQGAATTLVAAFDPALAESSGAYLSDCQIAVPAAHADTFELAQRLWHLSEQSTHDARPVL